MEVTGDSTEEPITPSLDVIPDSTEERGAFQGECSGTNPVEVIARGRASVLRAVIQDSDAKFEAALASQENVAQSIDRLTRVLDKLLDDTPVPLIAQESARVHGIRKRVLSLTSTLQVIRVRMKNIESSLLHKSPRSNLNSPRLTIKENDSL